jgi:cystathionine gamma-lyase
MAISTNHFSTKAIHAGQSPDPTTGAVMQPIYATSTYAQKGPGEHTGFEYSRSQNPTRFALERCLAELEEGKAGFAFASGLAAESTLLELLTYGDHIIAVDDLYGGTFRLFERVKKLSTGITVTYIDPTNPQAVESAINDKTRMIWVETPTNPLLRLADLDVFADIGRRHNLITVCDNTFASPWGQQPIRHGFQIVVHSITKYINGHSDMIGGAIVVGDHSELIQRLGFLQNAVGAILGPFDSFLALRGVKTLPIRMERHSINAQRIAEWLQSHSKIEKVLYPGLDNHPQHALAKKQMRSGGGMVSAYLRVDMKGTSQFLKSVRLFTLAESLGGVESLVNHPANMTHASIPPDRRARIGITDNLVRFSIGIEDADDLISDLQSALDKAP